MRRLAALVALAAMLIAASAASASTVRHCKNGRVNRLLVTNVKTQRASCPTARRLVYLAAFKVPCSVSCHVTLRGRRWFCYKEYGPPGGRRGQPITTECERAFSLISGVYRQGGQGDS